MEIALPQLLFTAGKTLRNQIDYNQDINRIYDCIEKIYGDVAEAQIVSARQAMLAAQHSNSSVAEVRQAIGHLRGAYNMYKKQLGGKRVRKKLFSSVEEDLVQDKANGYNVCAHLAGFIATLYSQIGEDINRNNWRWIAHCDQVRALESVDYVEALKSVSEEYVYSEQTSSFPPIVDKFLTASGRIFKFQLMAYKAAEFDEVLDNMDINPKLHSRDYLSKVSKTELADIEAQISDSFLTEFREALGRYHFPSFYTSLMEQAGHGTWGDAFPVECDSLLFSHTFRELLFLDDNSTWGHLFRIYGPAGFAHDLTLFHDCVVDHIKLYTRLSKKSISNYVFELDSPGCTWHESDLFRYVYFGMNLRSGRSWYCDVTNNKFASIWDSPGAGSQESLWEDRSRFPYSLSCHCYTAQGIEEASGFWSRWKWLTWEAFCDEEPLNSSARSFLKTLKL